MYQEKNVGIEYEYSIPSSTKIPEDDLYTWTHSEFEPCSQSCGGGTQKRTVSCNNRATLETVDESLCNSGDRPVEIQQCNHEACPPQWFEGEWSKCSEPCGNNGTKTREIYCQRIDANG